MSYEHTKEHFAKQEKIFGKTLAVELRNFLTSLLRETILEGESKAYNKPGLISMNEFDISTITLTKI